VDSNRGVGGSPPRIVARRDHAQNFAKQVGGGKAVRAGAFQSPNILFFETDRGRDRACHTFNILYLIPSGHVAHLGEGEIAGAPLRYAESTVEKA
jgi:hypothetical protein